MFVTASSSLYAIDDSDGSIFWKRELEGASDYVLSVEGSIWATSSVYEIEVGDYTESSIWRFNRSGELVKRWVIPERCWFIGPSFGKIILGLGRPRCGILSIDGDDLVHFEIGDGNPIVCGDYTTQDGGSAISILGHSSGAVSWVEGHTEEVKDQNRIGSPWRAPIIEESSAACCILVPGIGSELLQHTTTGLSRVIMDGAMMLNLQCLRWQLGPLAMERLDGPIGPVQVGGFWYYQVKIQQGMLIILRLPEVN